MSCRTGASALGSDVRVLVPDDGSFARFDEDVRAFAARCRARYAGMARSPYPRVVAQGLDRYVFLATLLGAWRAGEGVTLVLGGQARLAATLAERAHVSWLGDEVSAWFDDARPERAATLEAATPREEVFEAKAGAITLGLGRDAVACEVWTSGSTGEPVGVTKTVAQLFDEASVLGELLALSPRDRVLATVPPTHLYGLLASVLAPCVRGAGLVVAAPLHAEGLRALALETGTSVLVSTPAHLRSLEVLENGTWPALRVVVSSGAPLSAEVAETVQRVTGAPIVELLGSTETGGLAFRWVRGGVLPPFTPLPGVRLSVVDGDRLVVDSPFLAPHEPRPMVTADRVVLTADGRLTHLGRADDIVKVGGRRVSLREVEQRLLALPGVDDAAVLALPSEDVRGVAIVAVVVTKVGETELRRRIHAWDEPSLRPRRVLVVKALPREPTGKLRREVLEALVHGDQNGGQNGGLESEARSGDT